MGYHLLNTEIFKLYLDKVTKMSIKYIKTINLTVFQNPMRKKSRPFRNISESCRWWDCSMDGFVEWPFEGDPKCLIVQSIVS